MKSIKLYFGSWGLYILLLSQAFPATALNHPVIETKTPSRLILNIKFSQPREDDTVFLSVSSKFIGVGIGTPEKYYAIRNKKGFYSFNVPVKTNFGYFTLEGQRSKPSKNGGNKMVLMWPQFWEKGDSVVIEISLKEAALGVYSKFQFSGKGFEKYKARQDVSETPYNDQPLNVRDSLTFETFPLFTKSKLDRLDELKSGLSLISYNVLKSDTYFSVRQDIFLIVKAKYARLLKENNKEAIEQFKQSIYNNFSNEGKNIISQEGLENSSGYLEHAYRKAKCLAYLRNGNYDLSGVFNELVNNYKGNIRDVLLIRYFLETRRSINVQQEFQQARRIIKNTEYQKVLLDMQTSLPGRKINDYTLTDIDGKIVKLSDFDNKIVFMDFWFTGCGYCSIYYKNVLSKIEEQFRHNPNIVFLSISTDTSAVLWKKSVLNKVYTSPKAINLYTQGEGFDHKIVKETNILGCPFTMLLNKGRMLHAYNSETLYSYESLLKEISSLL